jgi:hypothetical protein
LDLAFNPAMQEHNTDRDGNDRKTPAYQQAQSRATGVGDEPPEQTDVRDYHLRRARI